MLRLAAQPIKLLKRPDSTITAQGASVVLPAQWNNTGVTRASWSTPASPDAEECRQKPYCFRRTLLRLKWKARARRRTPGHESSYVTSHVTVLTAARSRVAFSVGAAVLPPCTAACATAVAGGVLPRWDSAGSLQTPADGRHTSLAIVRGGRRQKAFVSAVCPALPMGTTSLGLHRRDVSAESVAAAATAVLTAVSTGRWHEENH